MATLWQCHVTKAAKNWRIGKMYMNIVELSATIHCSQTLQNSEHFSKYTVSAVPSDAAQAMTYANCFGLLNFC